MRKRKNTKMERKRQTVKERGVRHSFRERMTNRKRERGRRE